MIPVSDAVQGFIALVVLVAVVLLIIGWRVEADRRVRAERSRDVAAELARIAETRRDILAMRMRAAGGDPDIRTLADARRTAGA